MTTHARIIGTVLGTAIVLLGRPASAQTVGTFSWQLQPYCNVVKLTVIQQDAQYQLDGTDTDCSGTQTPSAVRGLAFPLPDGTVRLGLSMVAATTAVPVAIDVIIDVATLSGTWRDSSGYSGTFVLGASGSGVSRPAASLGAVGFTLTNGSVTRAKIADGNVTADKIKDGNVTADKLAVGAVTADKLAVGAVTGIRFGDGNVVIGPDSFELVTTGRSNTGLGSGVLALNTSGQRNTAIGFWALRANTNASSNTAIGYFALRQSTTGGNNTATGLNALRTNTGGGANTSTGAESLEANTTGSFNTAIGYQAMSGNSTGDRNTAIGSAAGPVSGNLSNTTAIGDSAVATASNMIRLGNPSVTVIQGQVAFTASSDRNQKEGFRPVDGDEVLGKLRTLEVTSWNYIGHDATRFRHYGPMAQDFFARFGHDGVGTVGSDVTLNSGDVSGLLIAALQAADRRTEALATQVQRLTVERDLQSSALAELRALVENLARQLAQQH